MQERRQAHRRPAPVLRRPAVRVETKTHPAAEALREPPQMGTAGQTGWAQAVGLLPLREPLRTARARRASAVASRSHGAEAALLENLKP